MLRLQNLQKRFGDLVAVDALNLEIRSGTIFGLLGPNGAGKTTTISMVSGILEPTAGCVEVGGILLSKDPRAVKAQLGVVPQEVAVYEELSARENLNFWGGLYGLKGQRLKVRVDELLELVGLADRAKEPVKKFSGGMKRRLNLAMGIIHEPKLILLDEPTVGIDPQARRKVLDVVEQIVRSGSTVLYTTHYLEEAEHLCDELAIMDNGKILAQGTIEELKASLGEGSVVTVSGDFGEEQLHQAVAKVGSLQTIEATDGSAMLLLPAGQPLGGALESLFATELNLVDVSIKEPNLEDLFLKLTGRELRD